MNWKQTERIAAGFVFLWALVLYLLTVSPTASFWDSGEFIAIANRLQVSHPPGAPFYMLVGRLFSMFVPVAYISLAVNLVSVLASALTILLTHLIIVRIIKEWQTPEVNNSTWGRLIPLAGGIIGALTFAATDSFWFNAVEAEVYALSMFFTAIVVWLILYWAEEARKEMALHNAQHAIRLRANRYLILIAYMFGLAIGVHLLNLLALFFIALIIFFVAYYNEDGKLSQLFLGLGITGVISTTIFLTIYPGIIQWLPGAVGDSTAPMFIVGLILFLLIGGIWYTQRKSMAISNLVLVSLTMVLIGYSTYSLIFIRSAANPPIDENDPETLDSIVSYLKREQYGNTPLLTGNTYNNETRDINYDREVTFPRRHSPDPNHLRVYSQYQSDMDYFFKYQIQHMYMRYFFWNFVGRGSDEQDAPAITGFSFVDDDAYGPDRFVQSPSERESRNAYFALPLLLGLFGAIYHFRKDWRRGFSILILFFVTGIGIIIYLNQTPLQPRERDYAYVASFFAFSLWVGIGAAGILQLLYEYFTQEEVVEEEDGEEILKMVEKEASTMQQRIMGGVALLMFAVVPLHMTLENYQDHDRSGRYVAPEYAYNMLMSVADDAILITNGDNDTFPLWYAQEVEGVRQDVRVVNISLLNTPWYIKQLKNQSSRDSEPLPISYSDSDIENLKIIPWRPREMTLPVDTEALFDAGEVPISIEDTSLIENPMRWNLNGRPYNQQVSLMYVADQALFNMLRTNAQQGWKRPFYFAVTVSQDGQLDLQNYFQLEGQAFRVVPIRHEEPLGRVSHEITPERLKQFKFTNLNNPDVYFDENIRRMVDNYRNIYVQTAQSLAEDGDSEQAILLMDTLMENIPFETIPGTERSFLVVSRAYQTAGQLQKASEILTKSEPLILNNLKNARSSVEADRAARFVRMVQLGYLELEQYEAASSFSDALAEALEDDVYRQTPEQLRQQHEEMQRMQAQDAPATESSSE